ncbi:MAG: DUF1844 domain-containing protein [Phycisphaeraceae bacterium]|nr:DUF1844 domain-containing protein [Phycisphaeraceae bacterium]
MEAGQEGNESPKIHIDSDWKAEAQAEKEKLAEQSKSQDPEGAGGGGKIPPANFDTLLSTMTSQALLYMGAVPDPMTGQRIAHLDLASLNIDLLGVLEEKTKGNLSEEEQKKLSQTLNELRMLYAQLQKQLAAQGTAGGGGAQAPEAQQPPQGPDLKMP